MTALLDRPTRPLSAREVARLAGVSYRQLDYWIRVGLVVPEREAAGSGSQRSFTAGHVPAVRACATLVQIGVDHEVIRQTVERIEREGPEGELDEADIGLVGVTIHLDAFADAA